MPLRAGAGLLFGAAPLKCPRPVSGCTCFPLARSYRRGLHWRCVPTVPGFSCQGAVSFVMIASYYGVHLLSSTPEYILRFGQMYSGGFVQFTRWSTSGICGIIQPSGVRVCQFQTAVAGQTTNTTQNVGELNCVRYEKMSKRLELLPLLPGRVCKAISCKRSGNGWSGTPLRVDTLAVVRWAVAVWPGPV